MVRRQPTPPRRSASMMSVGTSATTDHSPAESNETPSPPRGRSAGPMFEGDGRRSRERTESPPPARGTSGGDSPGVATGRDKLVDRLVAEALLAAGVIPMPSVFRNLLADDEMVGHGWEDVIVDGFGGDIDDQKAINGAVGISDSNHTASTGEMTCELAEEHHAGEEMAMETAEVYQYQGTQDEKAVCSEC